LVFPAGFFYCMQINAVIFPSPTIKTPVLDHLGSRHRVAYVHKMLEHGTGADRQLAVFEKTKKLAELASYINSQYLVGI